MSIKHIFAFALLTLLFYSRMTAIDGVIVVTTDPAFHDKWHYTLGENVPEISQIDSVFPGQKFSILLFLSDFETDALKNPSVTYDLEVRNPNYELIFEQQGIKALSSQVLNSTHVLLSETSLKVSLDANEKPGDYLVKVRLYDWNANVYKDLESTIVLTPLVYKSYFTNDDAFLQWKQQYYRNPRPEVALDGLLYMTRSELIREDGVYWPMFSFFLSIYKSNPFLLPVLADLYPEQSPQTRSHLLYILRFAGCRDAAFFDSLEGKEREIYERLLNQEIIPPTEPAKTPRELEVLWAEFFAKGDMAGIRKVVNTLAYNRYRGAGRVYRSQDQPDNELGASLYEGLYQNAVWTLVDNCENHPLVRNYCQYLYEYGKLPENVKKELGEILGMEDR